MCLCRVVILLLLLFFSRFFSLLISLCRLLVMLVCRLWVVECVVWFMCWLV